MRRLAVISTFALTLAAACSTSDTGQDVGYSTQGGLLSLAPVMEYGQTVDGRIHGPQLDIWALDVKAGDQLTLEQTVSDGDLKPDMVLFRGNAAGHISSVSYDVGEGSLTKSYELDQDGRYFIAVRAYQGQGEGGYTLGATCTGGPCAGQTPPPAELDLTTGQIAECMMKTRRCSIEALPAYDGAVGPVTAKKVFDECLAASTIEDDDTDLPVSCTPSCEGEHAWICDSMKEKLPWFADRNAACLQEWDWCMSDCYQAGSYDGGYGEYDDDELAYTVEGICVHEAILNGNCWTYVNSIQSCGGAYDDDSVQACHSLCESTTGAFIDDLGSICDDACGALPEE